MTTIETDNRTALHMRWNALARWDNEGGAIPSAIITACSPTPVVLLTLLPAGGSATQSARQNQE